MFSSHHANMVPPEMQGDAEDLPFATGSFDRYVSAGSIGSHESLTHGLYDRGCCCSRMHTQACWKPMTGQLCHEAA